MKNSFLEILDSETKGLKKISDMPSLSRITEELGFELHDFISTKNIEGDEVEISIYKKGYLKIVTSCVYVETRSEGVLHYQSYYASEELTDVLENLNMY
ncbi:MAG: hypothetical protein K9J16_10625 [Melioribacteraceae bacterium]|nr:hypothetical protein [Melioribacteraceae bacterium]MCF8354494.1 hypothetical protein [Melioribacteraceae bacterium]MCF8394104.1 hypothetical protein [Melioribacteraceae bacterium]MCF8419844.1 hypothetical protein [Melioribacteraceae bacterium]